MPIKKFSKSELPEGTAKTLHEAVFGEKLYDAFFKYDFVYLGTNEFQKPTGYVMVREVSDKHGHLVYGGTVLEERGFTSIKAILEFLEMLPYKKLTTEVGNHNKGLIKTYLTLGFLIKGIRQGDDNIPYVFLSRGE